MKTDKNKSSNQPIRVLMAGPIPNISGGISNVAGIILRENYGPNIQFTYISTVTKGSVLYKAFLFIKGFFLFQYRILVNRPDIIHLHVSKGFSLIRKGLLEWVSSLYRIPVVLHLHGSLSRVDNNVANTTPLFFQQSPKFLQQLIEMMLNNARAIISLSPRYSTSIRTITDNTHIFTLFNPVDCAVFTSPTFEPQSNTVLFMGDFSAPKGAFDLLETIPIVRKEIPEVKYIFCGYDNNNSFYTLVQEAGLLDHVILPGFVTNQEKTDWFHSTSIFVLPSYKEGIPLVILEAMAAGLPIITTPVGGIPDILTETENALFITPGDISSLANNILMLLGNTQVCFEMGVRNRSKAKQYFDIQIFNGSLLDIYIEILKYQLDEKNS